MVKDSTKKQRTKRLIKSNQDNPRFLYRLQIEHNKQSLVSIPSFILDKVIHSALFIQTHSSLKPMYYVSTLNDLNILNCICISTLSFGEGLGVRLYLYFYPLFRRGVGGEAVP